MAGNDETPRGTRGEVIRPPQFQCVSRPDDLDRASSIKVQLRVDSESDKLGHKIAGYITAGLRSAEHAISITNKDPNFRILVHTVETNNAHEIVLAVAVTAVLNLSAVCRLELNEEFIDSLGLNEEQAATLRDLKVGADLHHMALEHGLKFMYSSGRRHTIQPYESILSLRAWTCRTRELSHVVNELVTEFESTVLQRQSGMREE
ncbi:MAG: hypothetical protein RDU20_18715 [Desulfomonilaceae bacterium]|nr:hypothetical protein [Desulfomonilaceae bacterium]